MDVLSNRTMIKNNLLIDTFEKVQERMLKEFPGYAIEYHKKGITFKFQNSRHNEYVSVVAFEINLIFEIVTIYLV